MLAGNIVPHAQAAGIYGRLGEGAEGVPGSASFRLVSSQPKSRHIAGSIAAAKPFAGAREQESPNTGKVFRKVDHLAHQEQAKG